MTLALALTVAAAGALGAGARFCLAAVVAVRGGAALGTFAVNVSGSFALGVLVGVAAARGLPADLEIAAGGGFLGAYTTYSTWMVQIVEASERGARKAAIVDLVGSTLAGTLAAGLGFVLGAALS